VLASQVGPPYALLGHFDAVNEADEWHPARGLAGVSRPGHAAAIAFKEKFGELRYNNANRCVAGDFVRKWLRDTYPDMRSVDRVRHTEMAVELALLPTEAAVEAAAFAASAAAARRRAAVNCPR